ncbi:hypothetical protein ACTGYX_12450, partial [Streptococcus suis]
VIDLRARGDLAMGAIVDPGIVGMTGLTDIGSGSTSGEGASWFTLWTGNTAVNMFAAGGSLASANAYSDSRFFPSIVRQIAANGNIYNPGGGM